MNLLLEAQHLGVSRRHKSILRDVSIGFGATGSVAIIGPNGAGKSTLLALLAGLETPAQGEVRLGMRRVVDVPAAERAQAIGFMPQHFEPHWDLVLEELLGMRLTPPRGKAVKNKWPTVEEVIARNQLQAFRGRRWSTLSGGEQARVLLATVLATDPPILLADEPGAALDVRHRLTLVEALAQRGRTRLVIVAMHDLDLAFRHFERIVVVADGRIVIDGGEELIHAALLDESFGVVFDRIGVPPGVMLRARLRRQAGP
ncbi:ABC transporter ATP-binding protein [Variovorax boronicumulans]|uniref:ABC transporter ATP-binding protein n=1 Tax=Variovorax boronicumulans TaxID=436515 RepID=UPI001C56F304